MVGSTCFDYGDRRTPTPIVVQFLLCKEKSSPKQYLCGFRGKILTRKQCLNSHPCLTWQATDKSQSVRKRAWGPKPPPWRSAKGSGEDRCINISCQLSVSLMVFGSLPESPSCQHQEINWLRSSASVSFFPLCLKIIIEMWSRICYKGWHKNSKPKELQIHIFWDTHWF